MELLNIPHANMRDENGQTVSITVVKPLIFAWFYSTKSQSLQIVSTAGSIVPTLMTSDAFQALYNQQPNQGVETNAPVQSAS